MTTPLLATKLHVPPPRTDLVDRPRLLQRLEEGACGKLTLISAPAGFGKTTLVNAWVQRAGRRVAWLSLDDGDNDPTRFLSYLIAALDIGRPGVGQVAGSMLHSPQPPPAEAVLTVLINDIAALPADLPVALTLVLDDYHAISAEPVHRAVGFLVDHMPPAMHLILLTRADPTFSLARLRAQDELTEIRAAELRFTVEEATQFLTLALGPVLPAEEVTLLERRTEGWIAGLQLAALSMRGREDLSGFIARLSGSHRYIVDYLVEEVLDRQSESVGNFLLRTSILDRLSGPLCAAVTEVEGLGSLASAQETLEYLERANLFVVPLDDERGWYRYHHLFADVLRSRLQQVSPGVVPELHRRAADWYEQAGLVQDAIHHALAAGRQDYAARLVEQHALSLMVRGELTTLQGWLQAVKGQSPDRPWLAIYQAWVLSLTGRLQDVEPWLGEAERYISTSGSAGETRHMRGHILAIRAHLATLRGEARQAIDLSRLALEHLPASDRTVRSVATSVSAIACQLEGELAAAAQAFADAARLGVAGGNLFLAVGATAAQADILTQQGRLRQAAETYAAALELAALPDGRQLPGAGRAYPGLAGILCEWNDLEAASHHARRGIELLRQSGRVEPLAAGYAMLARVRQAQGDLAGAEEAAGEAEKLAHSRVLSSGAAASIAAARVRLWLAQGRLEPCAAWAEQTGLEPGSEIPYRRLGEAVVLARVLLALGESEAALSLTEQLLQSAKAAGLSGCVVELLVLQSLALQSGGDLPEALKALDQAITAGQAEGYVRVFVDEGQPMEGLLRRARSHGVVPDYVSRLLAAFGARASDEGGRVAAERSARVAPGGPPSVVEPLSPRELEVLQLLAEGCSNREIAEQLVVAPSTAKKHVSNIFGKLGVQSRTQCVARARELRLIGE